MDRLNSSSTNTYDVTNSYLFNNEVTTIQGEIEERHNAYVTELNANHHPDYEQNKHINNMIYKLKHTDSISESKRLIVDIKKCMEYMQNELYHLRERTFIVKNKCTHEVYGVLAKGFTSNDRDVYIKNLSNYYDVILRLSEGVDNDNVYNNSHRHNPFYNFSCKQSLAITRFGDWDSHYPIAIRGSSSLFGDLSAMSNLHNGISAKVPDLTYNCGKDQFD